MLREFAIHPWSERLGWTLLHFLWQGAVVAIFLLVLLHVIQPRRASTRYTLGCVALILMAWCPVVTFVSLEMPVQSPVPFAAQEFSQDTPWTPRHEAEKASTGPAAHPVPVPSQPAAAQASATRQQRPQVSSRSWLTERKLARLAGGWMIGTFLLALRQAAAWMWTQSLKWWGTSAPTTALAHAARTAAGILGMRFPFRVLASRRIASPLTFGLLRPVICFPLSTLTGLSSAQLQMILLHELAHLRRLDYLVNLLQIAVETLLFFHPAVWWVNRQIRAEREHACDDAVVGAGTDAVAYAVTLAALAEFRASGVSLAAARGRKGALFLRIQRLLHPSTLQRSSFSSLAALIPPLILLAAYLSMAQDKSPQPRRRGDIRDRNGLVLATLREVDDKAGTHRQIRSYPYGSLASHLLGMARPDAVRDKPADIRGFDGIEKTQDAVLSPSANGTCSDIGLALDLRIQALAEAALKEAGVGRGAAVLLNPNNGEVLAMASVPNYDPNQFALRISAQDYAKLTEDQTLPLLNRTTQAMAPGSVFKIATALAAAQAGKAAAVYSCDNYVTVDHRQFPCWTVQKAIPGHGPLILAQAISHSCNCYFYQLALDTGIENLERTCRLLGFGHKTGIELEAESAGIIPGPATYQKAGLGKWTDGNTANVALGQGTTLASPLQLANLAAAVANGGKVWAPHLVREIYGPEGKRTLETRLLADLLRDGLSQEDLEKIREGMFQAVNGATGTAKSAASPFVAISAKTGTAQVKRNGTKDNSTWLIGFFPFDHPRYAFCIHVQNGNSGGGVCGPIMKRLAEDIMALEKGFVVIPQATSPMKGHFQHIDRVQFSNPSAAQEFLNE